MQTRYIEEADDVLNCERCGMPLLDNEGIAWDHRGYSVRVCCRTCLASYFEARDSLLS